MNNRTNGTKINLLFIFINGFYRTSICIKFTNDFLHILR